MQAVPDGRRHIVSLVLPGDPVGLDPTPWAGSALPVVALTPVIVSDAQTLLTLLRQPQHRQLLEACERSTWHAQRHCLDAVLRLGQQSAYQRLAHLLLDVHARLESVGQVAGNGFHLPVTHDVLADALGLSVVHLSRTLRQLRQDGLIAVRPGYIELIDKARLTAAASFANPDAVQRAN
jgi:CRP-like cAMP-binding protein